MEAITLWEVTLRVGYGILILVAANLIGGWAASAAAFGLERTPMDPLIRRVLVKAVRPLVLLLGVAALVHVLALDSVGTSIAAMLGGATLAIGLGLQKYLTDAAAGALLLTARPFNAGDVVNLGGITGTIVEIGLFFTRVADPDGNTKFVPNGKVTSNFIENITLKGTRRVNERISVGRDADVLAVKELILAQLNADERFLPEPAPQVIVVAIRDEAFEFAAQGWTENASWAGAGAALRERVLVELRANGVPLPSARMIK